MINWMAAIERSTSRMDRSNPDTNLLDRNSQESLQIEKVVEFGLAFDIFHSWNVTRIGRYRSSDVKAEEWYYQKHG